MLMFTLLACAETPYTARNATVEAGEEPTAHEGIDIGPAWVAIDTPADGEAVSNPVTFTVSGFRPGMCLRRGAAADWQTARMSAFDESNPAGSTSMVSGAAATVTVAPSRVRVISTLSATLRCFSISSARRIGL